MAWLGSPLAYLLPMLALNKRTAHQELRLMEGEDFFVIAKVFLVGPTYGFTFDTNSLSFRIALAFGGSDLVNFGLAARSRL